MRWRPTLPRADIYQWRFAPRATTRRNVETYVWPWFSPEEIPWGDQVQDGGAVLGFSYHDLMARLKTNGPDDAWRRLREILAWFREVQSEGGYRAYYAKPGRGCLQGGGPPVVSAWIRSSSKACSCRRSCSTASSGSRPAADGFTMHPRLPKDWPAPHDHRHSFSDEVMDITAYPDGRTTVTRQNEQP